MLFWKASVWEKYRYKISRECDTAGRRDHRKSGFVGGMCGYERVSSVQILDVRGKQNRS